MVHAEDPPAGSVDVRTFPKPSIATHSETDGHDKSMMPIQSTDATNHDDAPPGCAEVTTFPDPSTATQDDARLQGAAARRLVVEDLRRNVAQQPVDAVEVCLPAAAVRFTQFCPRERDPPRRVFP
jgi:hypothetical protein